jgi:hypothetical protein
LVRCFSTSSRKPRACKDSSVTCWAASSEVDVFYVWKKRYTPELENTLKKMNQTNIV